MNDRRDKKEYAPRKVGHAVTPADIARIRAERLRQEKEAANTALGKEPVKDEKKD